MSVMTYRQHTAIPAIIVASLLISNLTLDRMKTSSSVVHSQSCIGSPLTGSQVKLCTPVTYTVTTSGRPFTALRHAGVPPTVPIGEQNQPVDAVALSNDGSVVASLNALLIFVVLMCLYVFYLRYQPSVDRMAPTLLASEADIDGPVIESANLLNEGNLVSADKGTKGVYEYNIMVNDAGRMMSLITLPRSSEMHVIAIGEKSSLGLALTEKIDGHFLNKIQLEGDFPDYFKLYCTPGKEIEIRELLDPATMGYLVDTCQTYDIELFKDSLFIAKAANAPDDNTSIKILTEEFIDKFSRILSELVGPDPVTENP